MKFCLFVVISRFAERALIQATGIGIDLAASLRSTYYAPYAEGVSLLAERLGGVEWLDSSRLAARITAWLQDSLRQGGFAPDAISMLLSARTPTEFAARAKMILGR